jgi:ubiquinone/menaquinone biosynthesis C-methylase UbiE
MNEAAVADFWQAHPCGDHIVGGLSDRFGGEYRSFFESYDRWRYDQEGHLPRCFDRMGVAGKELLEIGLGQGADSEQLARRGAHWSGLDLTAEAVERVGVRFGLAGLESGPVKQGTVLDIPWPDDSFEMVFSHGVLHHVPDVKRAQAEIKRVLRRDGELIVMLYARRSLNYHVAIRVVRRAAIVAMYAPWRMGLLKPKGIVGQHLDNAKREGLASYLKMKRFTHASTDGPLNPYALVYDLDDVVRDFPDFEIVESWKTYLHAPPLPMAALRRFRRLESTLGWHLWVRMKPKQA